MAFSQRIDFSNYILERSIDFSGRDWVFSAVNQWITDTKGSRFFLLTGSAGSGKTAIASRLAQLSLSLESPSELYPSLSDGFLDALHFCWARDRRWINARNFAESVSVQLAARNGAFAHALLQSDSRHVRITVDQKAGHVGGSQIGVIIKKLSIGDIPTEDVFNAIVREPLEAVCQNHPDVRFTLLVDALDESLSYSGDVGILSILGETAAMPENIRFIVTSRPETDVIRTLSRSSVETLALSAKENESKCSKDLRLFVDEFWQGKEELQNRLDGSLTWDDFRDQLLQRSKSNFLHATAAMNVILESDGPITLQNVADLSAQLDDVYLEFLERLVKRSNGPSVDDLTPIIGTLAISQEPLSEKQISDFSNVERESVKKTLKAVSQLLVSHPPGNGRSQRFTLFHESFAEFLLSNESAEEFWCRATSLHQRLFDFIFSKYNASWDDCGEYGLRHLIYHAAEVTGDSLSSLDELTADFFRVRNDQPDGVRRVLEDARLIIKHLSAKLDVRRLLKWGWIHAGLKDRLTHQASPELLLLRVKLGQTDQSLEMINELDPNDSDVFAQQDNARMHMVFALAEQDQIDEALSLSQDLDDEAKRAQALAGLAERVAVTDPRRALDLVRSYDLKVDQSEFCRILAEDDEYVDEACDLAGGDGAILTIIASCVGQRDTDRAVEIAETIRPYTEKRFGNRITRSNDVAKSNIAIALADRDCIAAMEILQQLDNDEEYARGIFAICTAMAKYDAEQSLETVSSWLSAHKDRCFKWFEQWNFTLAGIAASANRASVDDKVKKLWCQELSVPFYYAQVYSSTAVEFAGRVDLAPLRRNELAARIAFQTLQSIAGSMSDHPKSWGGFESPGEAIGTFACAMAIFDLDTALELIDETVTLAGVKNVGNADNNAYFKLIESAGKLQLDHDQSAAVLSRIKGWHSHLANMELAKAFASVDIEKAFAVIDDVEPRFAKTRAGLVGTVGAAIDPKNTQRLGELLSRLPPYTDSAGFTDPWRDAITELCKEVAKQDFQRAIALRNIFLDRGWKTSVNDIELECLMKETSIEPVVDSLQDNPSGASRAKAFLALARAEPGGSDKRIEMLTSAVAEFGDHQIPAELFRKIVRELMTEDPWRAAELASKFMFHQADSGLLHDTLLSIIAKERCLALGRTVEMVCRVANEIGGDDDSFANSMSKFRTLTEICINVAKVLEPIEQRRFCEQLNTRSNRLAIRTQAWVDAATDPEAAQHGWEALEWPTFGWGEIVCRRAETDLDDAISLFHQYADDEQFSQSHLRIKDVYTDLLISAAKQNLDRAWQMFDSYQWEFDIHRDDALASLAEFIAKSDLESGIDVASRIAETTVRRSGICRVINAIEDPSVLVEDEAWIALFLASIDSLSEAPEERCLAFDALFAKLQSGPQASDSVVTRIVTNLALGDKETFLKCLPNMIELAGPHLTNDLERLTSDLKQIESILVS